MTLLHTVMSHDTEPWLNPVAIDSTILYSPVKRYKE